jgi:hypothetical protein
MRFCSLRSSASASARLVGPTASVFHSGDSKSSMDTKVGSPPMVRRTSCCFSTSSTFSPSLSKSFQLSSEKGLVMRGCSEVRRTFISKPNSTSASLARPAMGAACR